MQGLAKLSSKPQPRHESHSLYIADDLNSQPDVWHVTRNQQDLMLEVAPQHGVIHGQSTCLCLDQSRPTVLPHALAPLHMQLIISKDFKQYRDLFQIHITTVGDFLNQPQCNRLAKFLTWIRMLRMNRAWSDGSVPGPERTLKQSINQSKYA